MFHCLYLSDTVTGELFKKSVFLDPGRKMRPLFSSGALQIRRAVEYLQFWQVFDDRALQGNPSVAIVGALR